MHCPDCYRNFINVSDIVQHTKHCTITIDRLISVGIISPKTLLSLSYASVIDIEETEYDDDVYDLEVENNHNYFANDHLVHNCHQLVLEGLFGKVYRTTTTKELMDKKELAELTIKLLILKYSEATKKMMSKAKYQDEMDFIVGNKKRNMFIKNLTYSLEGNTLLLFQYVEKHGKILYDLFQEEKSNRPIFFVFGGTKGAQRDSIRKIVEEQENAIIIASVGTFSTGVNIKRLHNIIFTSPSKAKIKNLQSIGRGLRMGTNKDSCTLFDIADDLQYKKHINYTLRHMSERIKYYTQEKFDYKIYKISLEENQ